jgi:molybdenum cofactor biosynthesis protein MoaC
MVNITHKTSTHRTATAQATITVSREETITMIRDRKVPKGDIFEMSRAAGLFAAKKTSDMIPDCHPLPIESARISYEIDMLSIIVTAEIQTIYKTGVEVEAMHAASVVALTIYDMLKPVDPCITINQIKLLEKKGGKSDFGNFSAQNIKAAVIVCSDTISKGKKEDKAGKAILKRLQKFDLEISEYIVIPDEINLIQSRVLEYVKNGNRLVVITGGTGLSARDVTPEALIPIIHRRIPGIEEAIRSYGQERTPYSMLSRSIAGMIDNTLVLGLPGSTRGASESIDAVFPMILHIFDVVKGTNHSESDKVKLKPAQTS